MARNHVVLSHWDLVQLMCSGLLCPSCPVFLDHPPSSHPLSSSIMGSPYQNTFSPVSSTHLSFISIPTRLQQRPGTFPRDSPRSTGSLGLPRRSTIPTVLSSSPPSPQSFNSSSLPHYPTSCPNCCLPLLDDTMPALGTSAIVKPSQLSHHLPPTAGTSTESTCCVSAQSVTSSLLSNPVAGGNFVIFRRKTRTSSVLPPQPQTKAPTASQVTSAAQTGTTVAVTPTSIPAVPTQTWDVVSGHGFELTPRGSILYRGRERALESAFVATWTSDRGTLKKLTPLAGSRQEMRFALHGPGNHTSFFRTFGECNGKGSWRRLLGEDVADEKPTHTVRMHLPEVLAQMVALGVDAKDLVACLKQGEHGTLRLDFKPGKWTTPEERELEITGREKAWDKTKVWKKGWWYTDRLGTEVWIS
ncbi:hypothetical protein BZA05DRAFT_408869 [Tricharina praecox]|uniref:uncharacterized protein n=1 Tax=Tricharina praecox TaxID=43433 RepID=UPI00221FD726|nr:uncharacterized protein BZA05DRAFT_408869 [Tricharina praecox]KAI5844893.1 hypothetical protein BZA05DRAFT_408869 [Tricharina praecox]